MNEYWCISCNMGRRKTGVCPIEASLKINLGQLLKDGYFQRGKIAMGALRWTSTSGSENGVGVKVEWPDTPQAMPTMYLQYGIVGAATGVMKKNIQTVHLVTVPSNLSKGDVLYFLCPGTGRRCRVLYMAYDSPVFKSREAYENGLYYLSQRLSKLDYPSARYDQLDNRLIKLYANRLVKTYKGKPTKKANRIDRLIFDLERAEHQMWTCLPVRVARLLE